MADAKPAADIGELKDSIKRKDERIAELRAEIDELRDLNNRMRDNVETAANVVESWCETFGMEMTADGKWTWKPFWRAHSEIVDAHNKLVNQWNAHLHLINGRKQPIGRPLQASEAQISQVLKLRKGGASLSQIVDETGLGLPTVRTIVGKKTGADRTSQRHARIDISAVRATWKRQRRSGDALPKRAQRAVEEARALAEEARGTGRATVSNP